MADADRPRIYVEPTIPTTTEICTVDQVRAVINQHDAGRFRMSALFTERMLWNPRFRSTLNTRVSGLMAAELAFDAARENGDARRAARELTEDWPSMVTVPVRKQYRRWSLMLGVAFGQRGLELSPTSGRQILPLRPYWPGFASWYWSENGYRIQTYDAGVVDATSPGLKAVSAPSPSLTKLINPSQQPWVIDEPNGANSWRDGIIHAAWRSVLGHDWATRDQARASEKHGIGVIKAKFPRGDGDQNAAAIDKFTTDLTQMPTEGVVPLEQRGGPNGPEPGFDIEPFEFNGSGFAAISDTLNTNAVALAILLLGHNLTTEIKGGGSLRGRGRGRVHPRRHQARRRRRRVGLLRAAAGAPVLPHQLRRPRAGAARALHRRFDRPEPGGGADVPGDRRGHPDAAYQRAPLRRRRLLRAVADSAAAQRRRAGARRAAVAGERQRHGRRQQHHRRRRR
jgi:hypothetical protein